MVDSVESFSRSMKTTPANFPRDIPLYQSSVLNSLQKNEGAKTLIAHSVINFRERMGLTERGRNREGAFLQFRLANGA